MGPAPEWLELRVHGVHGTSPGAMLGVTDVVQVAGDGLTGVFRAADPSTLPERTDDDRVSVEAYSWGNLTSGVAGALGWLKRVLWLLLLPFALANLAYWARLRVDEDDVRSWFTAAAVRVSGLTLTAFFSLTASFLGVDLLGWQCFRAGVQACPRLPGPLQALAGLDAGTRLALGLLVPIAAVGVLAVLSGTTLARYERTTDPSRSSTTGWPASFVLARAGFWSRVPRASAARTLHLSVGLATACFFTAGHAWRSTGIAGSGWSWAFLVVLAALALALGAATVLVCFTPSAHPASGTRAERCAPPLLAIVGGLTLVTLVLLLRQGDDFAQYVDFGWHDDCFVFLFVVLTVAHLSVFFADRLTTRWWWLAPLATTLLVGGAALATFWHQGVDVTSPLVLSLAAGIAVASGLVALWHFRVLGRAGSPFAASAWNGAGASVFLAAAAWTALLFSTAAVTATADYLNADQSVARLTTSLEPFGSAEPSPSELHSLVLRGPVTTAPLTVGDVEGLRVEARAAWLRPDGSIDDDTGRPVGDPVNFYVDPDRLTEARLRVAPGTLVDDRVRQAGEGALTHGREVPVRITLSHQGHSALVLPPVLVLAPIAQVLWLVLAGAVLLWCCLGRFRPAVRKRLLAEQVGECDFRSRRFPDEAVTTPWVVAERDRDRVRSARVTAALAHRVEQLLNYVGAITAPIALLLVALSSTNDLVNFSRRSQAWQHGLGYVTNVGLYAALGLSALLLMLGAKVRADEGWRKNVGILWDLTTFWPREGHPLGPPCYAERVVPELLTRITWAIERGSGVVLSAHSQGSLIAVATLLRLDETQLERIRLVTYGSQVRGLYGRVFPGVVGPEVVGYEATAGPIRLGEAFPDVQPSPTGRRSLPPDPPADSLRGRLGRGRHWVNLFRRADPLGYRVFSDVYDDASDRVVLEVPSQERGDPGPTVNGHSAYQHSPEYRWLLHRWTGTAFVDAPTTVADLPALPPA